MNIPDTLTHSIIYMYFFKLNFSFTLLSSTWRLELIPSLVNLTNYRRVLRVLTNERQVLPSGADHGGEAVILGAVLPAGGGDEFAGVLHGADELVVTRPARVELYYCVQHH